MIFTGVVLVLL